MVRGDDVYLMNFWPLDNLNMVGGGLGYDFEDDLEFRLQVGLAEPNNPYQQQVSLARNRRWQGRTIQMLVEGQGASEDGTPLVVGRSFRDAPEVDGQVFAWGTAPVGGFVGVRVTQALEYDLWGDLATR